MENQTTGGPSGVQLAKLKEIYEENRGERSLMIYLQKIQEEFGYVPEFAIKYISDNTTFSESHIYGVITFYSQFRINPMGKNMIKICNGTACHVGGSKILGETLHSYLNVNENKDTTDDGLFTVLNVACLGCCALAPAIMVNGKVYGNLDVNQVRKIIDSYRDAAKNGDS